MVNKCFAPNCTSGYKSNPEKFSLFKGPSDTLRLEKWRQAIPRADRLFTDKDFLCEKHFEEHFILRRWRGEMSSGELVLDVPRGKLTLVKSAIPTLFPGCPKYLSKPRSVLRKRKRRQPLERVNPIKRPRADTAIILKVESISTEIFTEIENVMETDITDATETSDSFDNIWRHVDKFQLPAVNWAKHAVEYKGFRTIVFNEIILRSEKRTALTRKRVIIDECLGTQAYVFQYPLQVQRLISHLVGSVDSLAESVNYYDVRTVNEMLKKFHEFNVCEGGPSAESWVDCELQCAILDDLGHWRHKKCRLVTYTPKRACCFCESLKNTLLVHEKRHLRLKSARVRFKSTQVTQKIGILRANLKNERRKNARLKDRCLQLKQKVANWQKQFSQVSGKDIARKIKEINLLVAQEVAILESTACSQV